MLYGVREQRFIAKKVWKVIHANFDNLIAASLSRTDGTAARVFRV